MQRLEAALAMLLLASLTGCLDVLHPSRCGAKLAVESSGKLSVHFLACALALEGQQTCSTNAFFRILYFFFNKVGSASMLRVMLRCKCC